MKLFNKLFDNHQRKWVASEVGDGVLFTGKLRQTHLTSKNNYYPDFWQDMITFCSSPTMFRQHRGWQNYHFCEPTVSSRSIVKLAFPPPLLAFKKVINGCFGKAPNCLTRSTAILMKLCYAMKNSLLSVNEKYYFYNCTFGEVIPWTFTLNVIRKILEKKFNFVILKCQTGNE